MLLIAGPPKSGKTWTAVTASADDRVGRTLLFTIREDQPDEYAAIPGADFEIVVFDPTYRGLLTALREATAEPAGEKPTLWVIDTMSGVWDVLKEMASAEQLARLKRRAEKSRQSFDPDQEVDPTMDLWNTAKKRHAAILGLLRAHNGPVILTARMQQTTIMDHGKPSADKEWKIDSEKNLPFEVDAIIEMPEQGVAFVRGVRSVQFGKAMDTREKLPNFTVTKLWDAMGVGGKQARRDHRRSEVVANDEPPAANEMAHMFALAAAKLGGTEEPFKGWLAATVNYVGSRKDLNATQVAWIISELSKLPDHESGTPNESR